MLWVFIVGAASFGLRAAHSEGAGGHGDQCEWRHAVSRAAGAREEGSAGGAMTQASQCVVDEREAVEVECGCDAFVEAGDRFVDRPAPRERQKGIAVPSSAVIKLDSPEHIERDRRGQPRKLREHP